DFTIVEEIPDSIQNVDTVGRSRNGRSRIGRGRKSFRQAACRQNSENDQVFAKTAELRHRVATSESKASTKGLFVPWSYSPRCDDFPAVHL
ncbi:MAG TPA: hypothetical protein VGL82_16750, partial [Bryobacteraceae bacterium]